MIPVLYNNATLVSGLQQTVVPRALAPVAENSHKWVNSVQLGIGKIASAPQSSDAPSGEVTVPHRGAGSLVLSGLQNTAVVLPGLTLKVSSNL